MCAHFGCAAHLRVARVESRRGGAAIATTVIRKRADTASRTLTGGGITCRQALRFLQSDFYLSSPDRYRCKLQSICLGIAGRYLGV